MISRFGRLLILTLGLLLTACPFGDDASNGSLGLFPNISSEDGELDNGGSDIPPIPTFNACEENYPKEFTLIVQNVINGTLTQTGDNAPDNPALLEIGHIFGPDPTEMPTALELQFVTDSPAWLIGLDEAIFIVKLHLRPVDLSATSVLPTELIDNEIYLDNTSTHVGNIVAEWLDPFNIFDLNCINCPQLNEIYVLQACLGVLIDPLTSEAVFTRSQAFFVKPILDLPFTSKPDKFLPL